MTGRNPCRCLLWKFAKAFFWAVLICAEWSTCIYTQVGPGQSKFGKLYNPSSALYAGDLFPHPACEPLCAAVQTLNFFRWKELRTSRKQVSLTFSWHVEFLAIQQGSPASKCNFSGKQKSYEGNMCRVPSRPIQGSLPSLSYWSQCDSGRLSFSSELSSHCCSVYLDQDLDTWVLVLSWAIHFSKYRGHWSTGGSLSS